MKEQQQQLISNYLANAQLQLYIAQHTKVGADWEFHWLQPEINRLYFFREGEGTIQIRNREYHPRPGQLFLLPAGVEQSVSTKSDNTFRKYWCHFMMTVGEIHLFQLFHVPHYIDVPDQEQLESKFQELISLNNSTEFTAPLKIKSIMYDIISIFLESAILQGEDELWELETITPSISKIHTILSYMDSHMAEQMTIDELAKLVHFHPNYFIQLFKSMMGVSPIVYINKKRMDKAQQLLLSTNMAVSEIAGLIGMELYYFSRMFKKWNGFSPTEYRQHAKGTLS
jgi:AraC-like DNA-binding protein